MIKIPKSNILVSNIRYMGRYVTGTVILTEYVDLITNAEADVIQIKNDAI